MASKIKAENLRIVHAFDEDSRPEMSGEPEYEKEDRERIAAWERDEWHYIGVYLEVDLIVAGTTQTIRTPGLWGIEDDSDEDYLSEIAENEYEELVNILEQLGVSEQSIPPLESAEVEDEEEPE